MCKKLLGHLPSLPENPCMTKWNFTCHTVAPNIIDLIYSLKCDEYYIFFVYIYFLMYYYEYESIMLPSIKYYFTMSHCHTKYY